MLIAAERIKTVSLVVWTLMFVIACISAHPASEPAAGAKAYRKPGQPVQPISKETILCEAEEFETEAEGWQARNWGTNYYCATFANAFLSRQAYLGAPPQCEENTATIQAQIPEDGRYLALVRYEAPYRFQAQFTLRISQNGKTVLNRTYGSLDNLKIWPFNRGLKKMIAWSWGACENIVWEGHDAYVELKKGTARIELIASRQPEPAGRRNVDVVMLTSDLEEVQKRLKKERYLPLDGMLTQAGDLHLRLHGEKDSAPLALKIDHGKEHSPYWVHMRNWKPKTVKTQPGKTSDWVEVGSLLDTLNSGQWTLKARPPEKGQPLHYRVEFGLRGADGKIRPIRTFESRSNDLRLFYDGHTRYSQRIRYQDSVLYELVDYLEKHPVSGKAPQHTLIYCYTFPARKGDKKYSAARKKFMHMMALTGLTHKGTDLGLDVKIPNGYTDVRGKNNKQLKEFCDKLKEQGRAKSMATISLGDEIGLPRPRRNANENFRAWLKEEGLKPSDVMEDAGNDWNKITYSAGKKTAETHPGLYCWSVRFKHAWGIEQLKKRTQILTQNLPNVRVGANYSPHHGYHYLGEVHKWVKIFREGGMTMPWSEDYIWQVPVGTIQINFINLDLFRAGLKGNPEAKIHYYVMAHRPGNTRDNWRRQFYGDVMHGMQIVNLFELRPLAFAYTENYVNNIPMYQELRTAFHELGTFEDIIQDGRPRPGNTALWFSEVSDIWHDNAGPFAAAKRALYIAILHQQLPLDFVIEEDVLASDLENYKLLFLADRHVSRRASEAIADWVEDGGLLMATAGAGMFDEFNQPNTVMQKLLGVKQKKLDISGQMRFIKQDMPFADPIDSVKWPDTEENIPVIAVRSRIDPADAEVDATFKDGSAAMTSRNVGQGTAVYCAFLPGLSYFKGAIPKRPVDRGASPDMMTHFLPTDFNPAATKLFEEAAQPIPRPVTCSDPLVESRIIESKHGVLVPLVNWRPDPIKQLTVTIRKDLLPEDADATLASGRELPPGKVEEEGALVFTFPLDVADALIFRKD
ncbi:MAG: beta-galactosidase trimerization domain-containing protein [Candidatus Brocadiia bacterium]